VQARGYCDAMTFIESMPEVDAGGIVLWGDSYSAAQVIVVGAVDARPAAVIAQVPPAGPRCQPVR
jgi:cephalosporin-C deacetylase-like acetyl esterase